MSGDNQITEVELLLQPYDPQEMTVDFTLNTSLTDRQNRFVDLYMRDFDYKKAAKGAGYSEWTIKVAKDKILNNPKIRAEIDRRKIEDRHRYSDLDAKIISSLEKLAFFDVKEIYNEDGSLKAISDIDDDTAYAIESIDLETKYEGRGPVKEEIKVAKVRTSKKMEALKELAKIRGMYHLDNTILLEVGFRGILAALPTEFRESVKIELTKRIENKK